MTRVAPGWRPTLVDTPADAGLSPDHLPDTLRDDPVVVPTESGKRGAPRSAQQAADAEAASWAKQWLASEPGLADKHAPARAWPAEMGPSLPMLALPELRRALASFATETGLGWDALHPQALLRLPDSLLLAFLRILYICEYRGNGPRVWLLC